MSEPAIDQAEVPTIASEPTAPPTTVGGILRRLGPGLIIAGSIVGSGELIATTKTGAEAGFVLLWLILLGCVIKIFAQVELGRYTLIHGKTTMAGLNEVPGPSLGVKWLVWYWFAMFLVTLGQSGGILGGAAQTLAISFPLTGDFNAQLTALAADPNLVKQTTYDDTIWACVVTAITAVMLVVGRYNFVQNVATFLVASFTGVTMFCIFAQQTTDEWAVRWSDIAEGLKLHLPPSIKGASPLTTALATFGIIGVGANELIAYPYWCLEKGYARFTGRRDDSPGWVERVNGWMRVMRWDAWCSMVVYTFATVGFYILGAGVLHRQGLNPAGNQMVRVLSTMYVPTFGELAEVIFLFGACAVLFSTFFVGIAGHARVVSDALRVSRLGAASEPARRWWVRLLCAALPCVALGVYVLNKDPVTLVLLGGLAQAMMLPMLALAAVYFRYRRCDSRVAPGRLWDVCLLVSLGVVLVTGTCTAVMHFEKLERLVKATGLL